MRITAQILTVHTTHPFIIARGGTSEFRVVWVRLQDNDGVEGWGEAAPSRFYGETAETVMAAITHFEPLLAAADSWSIDAIETELIKSLRWNASARCAISAALHDLMAKRLGIPLYKLWGLSGMATPECARPVRIGSGPTSGKNFSRSSGKGSPSAGTAPLVMSGRG